MFLAGESLMEKINLSGPIRKCKQDILGETGCPAASEGGRCKLGVDIFSPKCLMKKTGTKRRKRK